ncbi:hypothetical protein [Streptomyces collinus]
MRSGKVRIKTFADKCLAVKDGVPPFDAPIVLEQPGSDPGQAFRLVI